MKQALYGLLCCLFMACSSAKNSRRAEVLQRNGYLKTTATTVAMPHSSSHDSIKIQYIGCGGYLIRRGDYAVLIDPYFSNARLDKCLFQTLKTDTALVNAFFYQNFTKNEKILLKNAQNTEGVSFQQMGDLIDKNSIKATLISHAHHDHLADLPYIYQHHLLSPKAVLLGSQTASHILQSFNTPYDPTRSFVNLDSIFKKKCRLKDITPVRWLSENHHLRITAIKGQHAPHFLRLKIPCIGGNVKTVPKHAPRTAFGFKEGKNYNYLIDFLSDTDSIIFRIYSCGGSAARGKVGFLPPSVFREKTVDLLILCGANYNQVAHYPKTLLRHIQPKRVLMGHWEDFFTPIPSLLQTPQTVRLTNIPKFVKKVKAELLKNENYTEPIMLQPLTVLTVRF